jgi:16S rRNA processing protein RimM
LRLVYVGTGPDDAGAFTVADVKLEGGRTLLLLKTVEDRTAAEKLRGMLLFVESADAAPPPPGGFYVHDIVGCRVRTADGAPAGIIEDVIGTPGSHLWSVRDGDRVYLVPAVKEFIVSVDVASKTIVVSLPEGLRGEEQE